ncbi:uncharacterized protein LOC111323807 isoform X1 [Stylophora pistillata]|uniref:Uncharacterized protein n=2 Tax=Stylophora pistillata TaxID=50429 RepID=A0A2B4T1J5_STYPI|nr:uncharacterized protein LOC111323807 isoform X1 [Stylophora pistillata]PFX34662.1 hypothetical protein AWC38_SpisGene464 [Stylophora pistillata]
MRRNKLSLDLSVQVRFSEKLKPIMLLFTAVVILGSLYPCNAELPAVGNCTFMEYYCSLRNYESTFFKAMKEETSADCGLQFWILFYRSIEKSRKCSKTRPESKVADIEEMRSLYCSGKDLEIPLVSSLSLCSPKHKSRVDACIRDYAVTFSRDPNDKSLCSKRGEARICVKMAWRNYCTLNITATSTGIFENVTTKFNPFCDGERDAWASGEDQCMQYYEDPIQSTSPTQPVCSRVGRREYSMTVLGLFGRIFGFMLLHFVFGSN